jgi:hypothetical protein
VTFDGWNDVAIFQEVVMAGLDAAIHVLLASVA